MARRSRLARKTRETDIRLELDLDGTGKSDVRTTIPFFDHMIENFARHGLFDLKLRAKGDTEVDFHHTVEDVGIVLGAAIKEALSGGAGIRRCGSSEVPMMDCLSSVVIDLSNRPYFRFSAPDEAGPKKIVSRKGRAGVKETFDIGLAKEFLKALSNSSGADLHVTVRYGEDIHHMIESVFKALGRALGTAVAKDTRIKGVLSTKGKL